MRNYITYCCLHLIFIFFKWNYNYGYLIGIRLHRSSKECSAACTRTSSIVIMGSRLTHSTNWTWHWYMNFRLHFQFIFIDFFFDLDRGIFINASLILTYNAYAICNGKPPWLWLFLELKVKVITSRMLSLPTYWLHAIIVGILYLYFYSNFGIFSGTVHWLKLVKNCPSNIAWRIYIS